MVPVHYCTAWFFSPHFWNSFTEVFLSFNIVSSFAIAFLEAREGWEEEEGVRRRGRKERGGGEEES